MNTIPQDEASAFSPHTMLNALFGFNQAMNDRLWTIILGHLDDEQFTAEDPYSRGSLRNQLVHMAYAHYYWFRGLLNMTHLPVLDARDYPTREEARAVCQQSDRDVLELVRSLSSDDLQHISDGWSQPVWVALLQLAHHGTDHRSQILRTLHDLGAPTFEQNFAEYMENVIPTTAQDLVQNISARRAEWDALLRQLPHEQMSQPLLGDQTVRDVIAMLSWKEQRVTEMIRTRTLVETIFGRLPATEQTAILETARAEPLPALLEQHHTIHRHMLDALQTLSDEDLNTASFAGLAPDQRLWKAIAGTTWWSYPAFYRPLRRLVAENTPAGGT